MKIPLIMVDPPCELKRFVEFAEGICPYSNLSSCEECVQSEWDLWAIRYLRDSREFGVG